MKVKDLPLSSRLRIILQRGIGPYKDAPNQNKYREELSNMEVKEAVKISDAWLLRLAGLGRMTLMELRAVMANRPEDE